MKNSLVLFMLLGVIFSATVCLADTVAVSTNDGLGWGSPDYVETARGSGPYVQYFTVPQGWTLDTVTWSSINADSRNVSQSIFMQLYSVDDTSTVLGTASTYGTGGWGWYGITMNLAEGVTSGDYFVQVFSNDSYTMGTMMVATVADATEVPGTLNSWAATGWGTDTTTPLADTIQVDIDKSRSKYNRDAVVGLTYTTPEPATMVLFGVGSGLMLLRRRKAMK